VLSPQVPSLEALQVLLAVDRAGSLRAAAAEVGVSQQAVSARMRSIEAQVGVPLLNRSPRGSQLNQAGVLCAQWAFRVLAAAAELDAGITSLRTDQRSRLRVAASQTVAEHLMPGWLVAFQARLPPSAGLGPEIELTATNSEAVLELVLTGVADVGFVEGPGIPRGLRSRVVAHDRLAVVVPPSHRWARRRSPVPAAELAATPLVSRESGSGTRRALADALTEHLAAGTTLAAPAMELSSAGAVRAAVIAGAGPGALSLLAVSDDLALGRLVEVPLADVDLTRRLRAIWQGAGQPPAGPVRDLIAVSCRRRPSRP
jgi:DNA-binding transcriptional LysR family regulator